MQTRRTEFIVYKGLQSPLVFKGFKGKYIYWGLGSVLVGFVMCGILSVFVNFTTGLMFMLATVVGCFFYVSSKQKKGLHQKNNEKGIFIIPNHIKR